MITFVTANVFLVLGTNAQGNDSTLGEVGKGAYLQRWILRARDNCPDHIYLRCLNQFTKINVFNSD
jgi:hypothetical protein